MKPGLDELVAASGQVVPPQQLNKLAATLPAPKLCSLPIENRAALTQFRGMLLREKQRLVERVMNGKGPLTPQEYDEAYKHYEQINKWMDAVRTWTVSDAP